MYATSIESILLSIVGEHWPVDDQETMEDRLPSMEKLAAVAMWTADELTLVGRLDEYAHSNGNSRKMADGHAAIIVDMLAAMKPYVKQYAEEFLGMVPSE